MDRGKASFLGRLALFEGLPPERLSWVVERTSRERYRRRGALWTAGDPVGALYLVRSGVVAVHLDVEGSKRSTLSFHAKGDMVGEVGALEAMTGRDTRRTTTAVAHEELVVFGVPVRALREVSVGAPAMCLELALVANRRRRAVELRLAELPHRAVPARVCSALLQLAETFGVQDSRGTIVNLRLTHRELADLVGSTRETVSQVLSDLRSGGVLQSEGKRVVLLDVAALQARAFG